MLKLKIYAFIALLIITVVAVSIFVPGVGNIFKRTGQEPTVSVHLLARRYLETAEMISMHCEYNDVFEISEESLKNIYGMSIPGTKKHLIVKTRGTMYLGIDCRDITVDTTRFDTLFLTFPPIKIVAHEFEFTDIYDLSGVFRKYNLADIPKLRGDYRAEIEFNTKTDRKAISKAEENMERAFRDDIPTLKDVPIVFIWNTPVKNITIDVKRETPVSRNWGVTKKIE
ncbi:MAG: hypothetical protein LBB74_09020 [Chitinispirillales bacterium]|jgi:hypothetical protein|nr:hypothetical protein [Chitinispirillales bacterium]